MNAYQWIVVWQHKRTGETGHGEPLDYATARAQANTMNQEQRDAWHWLELANDVAADEVNYAAMTA